MVTRPSPVRGPTEYDVVLPDSAVMSLTTPFAESPAGDFVVYPAPVYPASIDSTRTALWYRSLLDGTTRRVTGDDHAYAPVISPDGKSLAYVAVRAGDAGGQSSGSGAAALWIERMLIEGGKPTVLARAKYISHLFPAGFAACGVHRGRRLQRPHC